MWEVRLTDTCTCIGYFKLYVIVLLLNSYCYATVLGCEFECVGQQVVHYFIDIIGHKGCKDVVVGDELEVNLFALGIIAVAFHNHSDIGRDVAFSPVGVAYG